MKQAREMAQTRRRRALVDEHRWVYSKSQQTRFCTEHGELQEEIDGTWKRALGTTVPERA